MPPANIETDPFFVLLTDALRTGPGSPQWNDAIATLRQQGLEAADEHRMLLDARENLEAGREYRSVTAGAGFTRKVMEEIEQGPAGNKPGGIPTATIVAVVCGLVILSVVGYFGWRMSTHETNIQALVADLETKSQGFVDPISAATFDPMSDGWHTIGSLKLDANKGLLHPAPDQENKSLGGGVVLTNPLPAGQPFAVDVSIHADPTPAVLFEIFVSTDGNFSSDKATSSHDLVWQLRGKEQDVLVNGSGKIGDARPAYHPGDGIRLIVGQDVAIVEDVPPAPGKPQRLWAGPHELGAAGRYIGVRFLQTGAAGKQDVSVESIKVTKAPT